MNVIYIILINDIYSLIILFKYVRTQIYFNTNLVYYIHAHMLHSTDAQGTTIQIKYTPSHKCTGF